VVVRISICLAIATTSGVVASSAAGADLALPPGGIAEPAGLVVAVPDDLSSAAVEPTAPVEAPSGQAPIPEVSPPAPPPDPPIEPDQAAAAASTASVLDAAEAVAVPAATSSTRLTSSATRLQSEAVQQRANQALGGASRSIPPPPAGSDAPAGARFDHPGFGAPSKPADPVGDISGQLAPGPGPAASPKGLVEPKSPASMPLGNLSPGNLMAPGAAAVGAIATTLEHMSSADSSPLPAGGDEASLPFPDPGSGLPDSVGATGSSGGFFFAFAAILLGLLVLAGRAVSRRIRSAPVCWRPVPFVSLLERPG
jgi:hypothetical protein